MPIPSANFGLTDVRNEFGLNTRPANHSLGAFHTAIFGSAGAGSKLSNFATLGKPTISNVSDSSDDDSFTVTFDIDINGVNSSVKVEWHEDDGQVPFSGQTVSSTGWESYSSNTTDSITVTNLDSTTQYWYRLVYYNDFNEHVDDHIEGSADSVTTDSPPQLTQPSLSGATVDYNGNEGYLAFTYGDSEDAFEVETRVDGTGATTTIQCTNNVGTTNSAKEIRADYNAFPSSSVEFRVRATATGRSDSLWSAWETATNNFSIPSCPL